MEPHLDIIIPTFNRCTLLERTLSSLTRATPPSQMTWSVTVADNRCTDGTAALVEAFRQRDPQHFRYCFAAIPGRSAALNAGVAATHGEFIGCLDDDEEVRPQWLAVVARETQDPSLDFFGGPCCPKFDVPPPAWIPAEFPAVIGRVDGPPERAPYGPTFPGILMGGNAVIRRSMLTRTGGFRVDLGRTGNTRLQSGEDRALYAALLRIGARGAWIPDLTIDHHVPASRLTKRYHRRWAFDHASSLAVYERGEQGAHFRIPRWRIGVLMRNAWPALVSRSPAERLRAQLVMLETLGFIGGAWRSRPRRIRFAR